MNRWQRKLVSLYVRVMSLVGPSEISMDSGEPETEEETAESRESEEEPAAAASADEEDAVVLELMNLV